MLLPHKILVSAKGDIMDTNLIKKKIFDQDIKQSKELPRFRYKLDLPEQKMLLCFFGQLKQDQDVFNPEFIPADDIIKYCGFEGTNPHQIIRTTAKRLSEKSIEKNLSMFHGSVISITKMVSSATSSTMPLKRNFSNCTKIKKSISTSTLVFYQNSETTTLCGCISYLKAMLLPIKWISNILLTKFVIC